VERRISSTVTLPKQHRPAEAWLRLRHPAGARPSRVHIDGRRDGAERILGQDVRVVLGVSDMSRPVKVIAQYDRPRRPRAGQGTGLAMETGKWAERG